MWKLTSGLLLILLSGLAGKVQTLDNGLALTPPMGWLHWQRFRCITNCTEYPDDCVSEDLFRKMADHLVYDGYYDAGYKYVIIDDCWAAKERDNNSRLQPDPVRFPNGIKHLSDYIHSKGLKFGIYADYGTKTCAGYPGSIDHLEVDANTFAEWGVDYLKLDACNADRNKLEEGFEKMRKYLNATGRPIIYSCSWPSYKETLGIKPNYTKISANCNLWRNWKDISDSWSDVISILRWYSVNQYRLAHFSGPGHWNDPDMLIVGNYGLSYEQCKAQMAIWAIMSAPLLMSVDLRTIEPKFRDILLHKDVIAINQDPLGIQGKLVLMKDKIEIWTKPILPKVNGNDSYAIGLLSQRVDGYPYRLSFTLSKLKLTYNSYTIKDVFDPTIRAQNVTADELIFIKVKPSGGALLRATPN